MANPPKPWRTEYAKSNRATCKGCSNLIAKDSLRIAKLIPATQFDGFMPLWYHANCTLKKPGQIRHLEDVEGLDALRWEDQKKLRKYINDGSSLATHAANKEEEPSTSGAAEDYAIENAKSGRAACKSCNEKIQKGQVRISTMVESDTGKFRGKVPAWRHAKCFLETGCWTGPIQKMPGWESLPVEDQEAVKNLAPPSIKGSTDSELSKRKVEGLSAGDPKGRKRKKSAVAKEVDVEKDTDNLQSAQKKLKSLSATEEFDKKLEKQTKALWKIKDDLKKHVDIDELRLTLQENGQDSSGSESYLIERCADGMMFGALKECNVCGGPLEYHGGQYRCRGNISEWTRCSFTTRSPERVKGKWKIPKGTENEYLLKWFKKQPTKKEPRLLLPQSHSGTVIKEDASLLMRKSDPEATGDGPFSGMNVSLVITLKKSQANWPRLIQDAGGLLQKEINSETDFVVTNEAELELEENRKKLEQAQSLKIPIVKEKYVSDSIERGVRLPVDEYIIETVNRLTSKRKVKVKGRSAVHEESGLQETGHVLEDGKTIYNTTLNLSDLSSGINSYYILQIIENDQKKVYHLFRKWGRVGNSKVGSSKLEKMSKSSAINEFKRLFREKTGNEWESWEDKENFKKQPNRFYPLEIDYGVDDMPSKDIVPMGSRSKLHPRVVNLMKMLFDIETYKAAMLEFEINMSEMPLGKLSKRNIEQGFKVLTEIQNLLEANREKLGPNDSALIDASNRFFTLIPHVHPQIIRDNETLKLKIGLLEALRDIEIASKLIGSVGEDVDEDPLDANYKKLCCNILPLPHDSQEFKLIQLYLQRTHAPTHKEWSLEVEDVFTIDRHGEYEVYAAQMEKLGNRMLLWHGSRTTNFVGILSQGLRVAPPEAPVTGYMFGKGIYFADLVSKSAQYCYTTKQSPVGLMLLSEVALGDMYELKKAQYIEKPPEGKHSTKGLGKNKPLESDYQTWGEQVTVPCGCPVPSGVRGTELMYNEYIVYNTSQVKLRFLLKVRFKHKR